MINLQKAEPELWSTRGEMEFSLDEDVDDYLEENDVENHEYIIHRKEDQGSDMFLKLKLSFFYTHNTERQRTPQHDG